jgi:hypothetical protein
MHRRIDCPLFESSEVMPMSLKNVLCGSGVECVGKVRLASFEATRQGTYGGGRTNVAAIHLEGDEGKTDEGEKKEVESTEGKVRTVRERKGRRDSTHFRLAVFSSASVQSLATSASTTAAGGVFSRSDMSEADMVRREKSRRGEENEEGKSASLAGRPVA